MPPRTRKPIEFPPIPAAPAAPEPDPVPQLCPDCFDPAALPPLVRSAGCEHGRWYFDADGQLTAFEP